MYIANITMTSHDITWLKYGEGYLIFYDWHNGITKVMENEGSTERWKRPGIYRIDTQKCYTIDLKKDEREEHKNKKDDTENNDFSGSNDLRRNDKRSNDDSSNKWQNTNYNKSGGKQK